MNRMYYLVFVASILSWIGVATVKGNIVISTTSTTKCDDLEAAVSGRDEFNATEYAGSWYVVKELGPIANGVTCLKTVFTHTSNTSFTLTNSAKFNGFRYELIGEGTLLDPSRPAEYEVQYKGQFDDYGPPTYKLISADYYRYSMTFACFQEDGQVVVEVLLLAREKDLDIPSPILAELVGSLPEMGYTDIASQFSDVDHTNCD